MREKIVLIGAGSAVFTKGMLADLINRNWDCRLALVDIDAEALAVAEGLAKKMIEVKGAPIQLSASTDRRDVLVDATVVICTIGVGGRRAWENDVFIPRKYGIYQPVGDSVMPGGTSRALRMIPAMVDIAKDVLDLCPNALFFNYGNPMAPVCRAVRKTTQANMVGLCHGVYHVGKYLADILNAQLEDMNYTAIGMNHLTWFTEVKVNGVSVMPRLAGITRQQLVKIKDTANIGVSYVEDGSAKEKESAEDIHPFSWELFKLFGAFPAAMDRHVTEYFPQFFSSGKYYGKVLGVDAYSFENCIAYGDSEYDKMKDLAFSKKPLPENYFDYLSGEHEQVIGIIESMRADAGRVYSVNLPNTGQVPNLPVDAIIESPATTTKKGLAPIQQKPIDEAIAGTLVSKFRWVETIADAAIEGNRKKFIKALVLDGALGSIDNAKKLADELLEIQKDYLPQFGDK